MERKYSIDLLRVLSAIAVIIIHTVSSPVSNSSVEIPTSLIPNLNMIHNLMNWSVPVFFMITGYCLLRKENCSYKYCFSHVVKYICVLFTVGLFYALLEEVFVSKTVNISVLVKSLFNVISGNLWEHMWFVYAIIGIYLVMPIIHLFIKQSTHNALILTGLLFLFDIFLPTFEKWITVGIAFPFGGYLFYVCLGGVIAQNNISKTTSCFVYLVGLLSAIYIAFDSYIIGYNHLSVCLMATSIFLLVSKLNIKSNKLLLCVSNCTLGIYLIHPLFINIAIKLLRIDVITSQTYLKLVVFTIAVLAVSFLSTYILRKIPLVKQLF